MKSLRDQLSDYADSTEPIAIAELAEVRVPPATTRRGLLLTTGAIVVLVLVGLTVVVLGRNEPADLEVAGPSAVVPEPTAPGSSAEPNRRPAETRVTTFAAASVQNAAVGFGSVWVTTSSAGGSSHLVKLNPGTLDVVGSVEIPGSGGRYDLAFTGDYVWVSTTNQRNASGTVVTAVDPDSLEMGPQIPLLGASSITADDSSLWVMDRDALKQFSSIGSLVSTRSEVATYGWLDTGFEEDVWVGTPYTGSVTRVRSDGSVLTYPLDGYSTSTSIMVGPEDVFVGVEGGILVLDQSGAAETVVEIDGSPIAISAAGEEIYVTLADGRVLSFDALSRTGTAHESGLEVESPVLALEDQVLGFGVSRGFLAAQWGFD